ncbi:nucleotidyltransferase family protein, partial [Cytophagia bacterium CHB2]|nr:nucleotidyltransferase family protein [Cytophagia bacterium CHB2]
MNAIALSRLLSYGNESPLDRILAELSLPAVEWQEILRQSRRHSVAPLLYHRLKQADAGSVLPVEVWGKLQSLYLRSAAINGSLYRDLAEALTCLQASGIAVIILKGGYLARHVYDNIALRPMGDFDLLVKEADLLRANDLLVELGYRVSRNADTEALIAKYYHLPPLIKAGKIPASIELHWKLERPSARFEIDTEELWRRAQPAAFGEARASALCPEDLLLHLCIHASYHHQFRFGLRSLCDIAEIIRHYHSRLDWEQLRERAEEWGVTKCVYLTLRLTNKLLEANVPHDVLQHLRPKELRHSFVAMSEAFTLGDIGDPFIFRKFGSLWKNGRWRDKLMIVKNSALPAQKTMAR